jgi:hypothetical protein
MCAIKREAGIIYYADLSFLNQCLWTSLHNKRVWVLREIMLGYKGVGGGEREGRDVDVSGICSYGFFEFLNELDGITDEESKCPILVLKILVAIFHKEIHTHFDLLL